MNLGNLLLETGTTGGSRHALPRGPAHRRRAWRTSTTRSAPRWRDSARARTPWRSTAKRCASSRRRPMPTRASRQSSRRRDESGTPSPTTRHGRVSSRHQPTRTWDWATRSIAPDAFERAATAYGAAVRLAPESVEARNNLGAALERLGRVNDAAAQYREAVRLAPNSTAARANLARVRGPGRP